MNNTTEGKENKEIIFPIIKKCDAKCRLSSPSPPPGLVYNNLPSRTIDMRSDVVVVSIMGVDLRDDDSRLMLSLPLL